MKQNTASAKRVARVKLTLTKRTVEALERADKPWIAWDDKLSGFGCRVQPSGTKSFIVNYRAGEGGRRAPNKRVVVGRFGRVTPEQARRRAQELLGRVAGGGDRRQALPPSGPMRAPCPRWERSATSGPMRAPCPLYRVRPRPGGRDSAVLPPLCQPLSR